MTIGWAWEWPPPRCGPDRPHEWVRDSFAVTDYRPGEAWAAAWWRCRECGKKSKTRDEKSETRDEQ